VIGVIVTVLIGLVLLYRFLYKMWSRM